MVRADGGHLAAPVAYRRGDRLAGKGEQRKCPTRLCPCLSCSRLRAQRRYRARPRGTRRGAATEQGLFELGERREIDLVRQSRNPRFGRGHLFSRSAPGRHIGRVTTCIRYGGSPSRSSCWWRPSVPWRRGRRCAKPADRRSSSIAPALSPARDGCGTASRSTSPPFPRSCKQALLSSVAVVRACKPDVQRTCPGYSTRRGPHPGLHEGPFRRIFRPLQASNCHGQIRHSVAPSPDARHPRTARAPPPPIAARMRLIMPHRSSGFPPLRPKRAALPQ